MDLAAAESVGEAIQEVMDDVSAGSVFRPGDRYVIYLNLDETFKQSLQKRNLDPDEVIEELKEKLTDPIDVSNGKIWRGGYHKGGYHFVILEGTA